METRIDFVNKIVRQGNSLCIRIPNSIIKEGEFREGQEIAMSIFLEKNIYKYDEKTIKNLLKIANKIKELNKYNELQKRFFLSLIFTFLQETQAKNTEEREKKQSKFIADQRKEFGNKFIHDFLSFSEIFNKKAFITESDGTTVLKSEYR